MLSRQELSIVGTERGATDHLPASLNANAAPSPQQQDRSAQQNKLESISKTGRRFSWSMTTVMTSS
jgi:hypothetical protein